MSQIQMFAEQGDYFAGRRVKVLSYGGGLDSFAMLVDALQRNEKPDLVIFADVGDLDRLDPGEWPSTYRHIEEVVIPLCRDEGIEFKWLGTVESPIRESRSLFAYFWRKQILPSRMSRLCTSASKVERIAEYLERRYLPLRLRCEVWVGFEAGEEIRAKNDPHGKARGSSGFRVNRFPLMEGGICRCRAERLVRAAGYTDLTPRKSACVYCPFSSRGDFQTLRRELPAVFAKVAALEEQCRRTKVKGKVMRFGYKNGDGTDPALAQWIASPYRAKVMTCTVCGQTPRATKATACDYLPERLALPAGPPTDPEESDLDGCDVL